MANEDLESQAARQHSLEVGRRMRAPILELAVRAEYLLGQALAHYLGADEKAMVTLQEHMTWRVPNDKKLMLISEAMEAYQLSETFPHAIPALEKLFKMQKILANSFEAPVPDGRREIGVTFLITGQIQTYLIRIDYLDWLWAQASRAVSDLILISSALTDLRDYKDEQYQWSDTDG